MVQPTPKRRSLDRRQFLASSGAQGAAFLAAGMPVALHAEAQMQHPTMRLGKGGEVLAVPENRELLADLGRARDLTPEQLFDIAARHRDNPTTAALADRLAFAAMAAFVASPNVARAMATIARTEVEWSWLRDVWKKVKDFFTPGTGYRCVAFLFFEKCGQNGSWKLVGGCVGFHW